MCEKNEDKPKENLAENNSPLELKDWILFLSSQSYQSVEITLLMVALILALVASKSLDTYSPFPRVIVSLMIVICLLAAGLAVPIAIIQKGHMDGIIKDIIYGELTDVNKIRELWKKRKKPERWEKCKKLLIKCKKTN